MLMKFNKPWNNTWLLPESLTSMISIFDITKRIRLLLAMIITTIQCNKNPFNYLRYLKNHFVSMEHNNFFR